MGLSAIARARRRILADVGGIAIGGNQVRKINTGSAAEIEDTKRFTRVLFGRSAGPAA